MTTTLKAVAITTQTVGAAHRGHTSSDARKHVDIVSQPKNVANVVCKYDMPFLCPKLDTKGCVCKLD